MQPSKDQNQEAAIGESMTAILDMAEKCSHYISTREGEVMVANSFITGMLVFLFASAFSVALLFVTGAKPVVIFQSGPVGPGPVIVSFHDLFVRGIEIGALAGIAFGLGMFYFLGRRENKDLKELEGLIGRIKTPNQDDIGS